MVGKIGINMSIGRIESVIPIYLSGGACAVYQQLSKEKREKSTVYDIRPRPLHHGETICGAALTAGRNSQCLFGWIVQTCGFVRRYVRRRLKWAFIARLPEHAKQIIWASSQVEDFDLPQVLERARAMLKNITGSEEQAVVAAQPPHSIPRGTQTRCYECDESNHKARDCLLRCETFRSADAKLRRTLACYRCQRQGHIAWDWNSAPVSSPKHT